MTFLLLGVYLLIFPASFIGGVLAAFLVRPSFDPFIFFIITCVAGVSGYFFWNTLSRRARFTLFAFAVFALGFWRGSLTLTEETLALPQRWSGAAIITTSSVLRGKTQAFRIRLDDQTPSVVTTLGVIAANYPRYEYGDRLLVECKNIKEGNCFFPTLRVLERGRGNPFLARLYAFKDRLSRGLSAALPEPEASLAAALLLGERAALPEEFAKALQDTGTVHIVAVSGMHIVILSEVMTRLFRYLSFSAFSRRGTTALLLILFTLMIGAPASAVRGLLFGLLLILAELSGRPRQMTMAIATTAAFLLFAQPQFLFDLGFHLSFLAVVGIVYGAPILAHWLRPFAPKRPFFRMTLDMVIVTSAATLATAPLLAAVFGRLSLVGIFANLLVVPLVMPTTVLTLIVAALSLASTLAATALGFLLFALLALMERVIEVLGLLPYASLTTAPWGPFTLSLLYVAFFVILFSLWRRLPPWERVHSSIEHHSS